VQFIPHPALVLLRILQLLVHYVYRFFQDLVVAGEVHTRLAQETLLQTQVPPVVLVAHLFSVALEQTLGLIHVLSLGVQPRQDALGGVLDEESAIGRKKIHGDLRDRGKVRFVVELNFSRQASRFF
jgi:hypothetical protein